MTPSIWEGFRIRVSQNTSHSYNAVFTRGLGKWSENSNLKIGKGALMRQLSVLLILTDRIICC